MILILHATGHVHDGFLAEDIREAVNFPVELRLDEF